MELAISSSMRRRTQTWRLRDDERDASLSGGTWAIISGYRPPTRYADIAALRRRRSGSVALAIVFASRRVMRPMKLSRIQLGCGSIAAT
jgi:hypothetical protein